MSKSDGLIFVPLGGCGEIGMNLGLYGYDGKWLMVDLGIGFSDGAVSGVDMLVPDPAFIAGERDNLVGIVVTHAHEDHLGAIAHLWDRLKAPVYATPFAAGLLKRKLTEAGLEREVPLNIVPTGGRISAGPFDVEFIHAAHSVPEGNILAIRTGAGTVVHATDWRLDPDPLIGPPTDIERLRAIGDEGVMALMCDSTNVMVPGESGSEAAVRKSLIEVVGRFKQRVVLTSFASNAARVETAAIAARANDRSPALVGRSLIRIDEIAREVGYFGDLDRFLTDSDAAHLSRDKVLLIATGSQGEPRSALARMAAGDHPQVSLEAGDVVIFSSKVIPGNEKSIGRLQNDLARRGVEILTDRDAFVHVSGHPAQGELAQLYELLRPETIIPVHGEDRMLVEHARFARTHGIPHGLIAENGAIVRLTPGGPEYAGEVPVGRLGIDGKRLLPVGGDILAMRGKMQFSGLAVVTLVFDHHGELAARPKLSVPGLINGDASDSARERAIEAVEDAVEDLPPGARLKDARVEETARRAVRRSLRGSFGKRPVTEVQVVRI